MANIMRVGGGAGGGGSKNPEVSTLAEGKILLITENGIPTEYYIAKHGYEPELNGPNRTLLVRRYLYGTRQWHSSNVNAYATSDIDAWLNGDFFNSLSSGVRDLLDATAFKYTVGNGNKTLSTLERAVFLLSLTEMGLSDGSNANVEGTALPIASTLRVGYIEGGAANTQWLRTAPTTATTSAYATINSGALGAYAVSSAYYVRPVFTIPSSAKIVGPDTQGRYTLEVETVSDVYGIARDITAQSPQWTRTDGAMTFSATASVGTVAGQSDFDNIYPWSEMKRVTLDSGDVMVRIPKFYYGRTRNGNIERIQISGRADVGLSLHPAFNHGGVEKDCIYVGAYKTSAGHKSVSGVTPLPYFTRGQLRTNAKAKGNGWGIIDISTLSAIQMLYLVEFANNNSQQMIGRGYCDGNSAAINTGSCDVVPNLTGRPAGTDGKTDIIYRGIEGLWGNVWEWVDGVNWNGGNYYVCNDPSMYADDTATNYTALSFTGSTGWNGNYITREGIDGNNPHIILPHQAAGGSESTYDCDACCSTTSLRVFMRGGLWSDGSACGLFMSHFSAASSDSFVYAGSRLIYIPQ